MIHSLAGGSFKEKQILDFAKVEILEGLSVGAVFWYILPFGDYNIGDEVYVPLGINNIKTRAKIVRIDKNKTEGSTPIPIKTAKKIIGKL